MLRSKQQQNQPNQEASTTSESRVAAHIAAREHVRRAPRPGERPGPRPSPATALAGWGEQEGKGPRFLPSLPFRRPTPRARGAQRRNGPQACAGESSQQDLTLLPTVPVEGTAGLGAGGGHSFPGSLAPARARHPHVRLSRPQLTHSAMPPVPTSQRRRLQATRAGRTSSPGARPQHQGRADMVPELWGAQAPQSGEGAPGQPGQDHSPHLRASGG